ncbi:MAG: HD-GYP domain-containing protein [Gammaproteobacteria bacterium]|nr:HD-GYP domain-containing protein [Gammaproteobacteria bacterium]
MNTLPESKATPLKPSSPPALSQLETMIKLSALMNSTLEEGVIRERAIRAASTLVNCEACSLLLKNNNTGGLYFDVATGDNKKKIKNIELKKGEGIAGWVALNKTAIIIKDAQNDPRFYKTADKKSGFTTENMLCIPVTHREQLIGVLQAINKVGAGFTRDDARLLYALANQIAVALENARLYGDLKESLYSVVQVLASTIEKRDPFSAGHSKRVSKYAVEIGKYLNLSKEDLANLKLGSVLHDVGMIAIPDNILQKKSRLLDSEREQVMKHVSIGEDILKDVKPLKSIIPIVKYHHERHDGKGYYGLAGDEIPLAARIVAVADAFDSMTSERPYSRCKGYDAARMELIKESGKQFDPHVVDAFFKSKAFRYSDQLLK